VVIMLKTRVLLIEDNRKHCQEYIDYNNEQGNNFILEVAHGCRAALSLLEGFQPDFVLLDLMLNEGDGSGIEFLIKYKKLNLLKCPRTIVITSILAKEMHENVLKHGIEFIITKDKVDYSPKFAFNFITDISSVSKKTGCKFNSEEMIKASISEMIEKVGFTYGVDGRIYLIDAIYLVYKNNAKILAHDIYPVLAKKYGKSEQAIEKAIYTAIHKTWDKTDISVLNKYYTPQTSFISGAPSIREFIFFFAEKVKA